MKLFFIIAFVFLLFSGLLIQSNTAKKYGKDIIIIGGGGGGGGFGGGGGMPSKSLLIYY